MIIFSIHASAKEATISYINISTIHNVFNPRLREGGDTAYRTYVQYKNVFNPRLREGGDSGNFDLNVLYKFSIHASAKEATEPSAKAEQNALFSIHASAKEATIDNILADLDEEFSIHASAKEATN